MDVLYVLMAVKLFGAYSASKHSYSLVKAWELPNLAIREKPRDIQIYLLQKVLTCIRAAEVECF
jgi:hypothetical protein